ncbi:hypothetical protein [Ferrimonas sp. SCSIO 43195]|uniref:hypothetical protein n=1 Tax=Ferrimonas sp. SCSIO 43195 TaxID=2822844 RepID=UPI002074E571|nr:hypothetical protein [Ferrimonas sp. SCSIO 43195]USD39591.1 hypothetical protein J8Z22_11140 [Ferrimonas sp. SCSIO 43195]
MESTFKSLIYLVQYLASERNDDEYTEEDDLKQIEEVASLLQSATDEEKAALISISKKLGFKDWTKQIGIE